LCVAGSVEDEQWRESLFHLPYPWYCDELMPSSQDMQTLGQFRETVNVVNFYAVIMRSKA